MKKAIVPVSALAFGLLASLPASAQIIIQPTIIAPPPPAYIVAPAPVYVAAPVPYPVHIDHHHHYDWTYWREHDRRGHEHERR